MSTLSSSLFLRDPATPRNFPTPHHVTSSSTLILNLEQWHEAAFPRKLSRLSQATNLPRRWLLRSSAHNAQVNLTDDERKSWESCREAVSELGFTLEEQDKILGKAFGHIHSPYWSEERKVEAPKREVINGILNYLRSLTLSEDDLQKVLKKFPEVLGCSLEEEVKRNVTALETNWSIKGKTLRNLIVRNPKVLGFTVDCKGDCIAQCTRCWARF